MLAYRPLLWTKDDYAPALWTGGEIRPTLWTSPARISNLLPSADGAAVARAVDAARSINKQKQQADPPNRTPTQEDDDGHELVSDGERLRFWSSAVTVTMVSSALTRAMTFTATVPTEPASLVVASRAASSESVIATLRRPTMAQLTSHPTLGLKGTKGAKNHRKAQADSLMAQAMALDFILLESLGRDVARHPSVYALLHVTLEVAAVVAYSFKHLFAVPRPATLWGDIEPLIVAPGHASFPSGHATQAFAAMEVLTRLLLEKAGDDPFALAKDIARNRVVAGIHYEYDSLGGEALGRAVGAWVASCAAGGKLLSGRFNAASDNKAEVQELGEESVKQVLLGELWSMAMAEIKAADKE